VLQTGVDPVVSDILHEARFQQLCYKFMLPSFDPDSHPLPSWLIDRTLLQLYAQLLKLLFNMLILAQIREAARRHWMGDTHSALQGCFLGEDCLAFT
jgi:hypothetical protein